MELEDSLLEFVNGGNPTPGSLEDAENFINVLKEWVRVHIEPYSCRDDLLQTMTEYYRQQAFNACMDYMSDNPHRHVGYDPTTGEEFWE